MTTLTVTENTLLERLITEAAKRGAIEHELTYAVKSAEGVAKAFGEGSHQLALSRATNNALTKQIGELQMEVSDSRNQEQAAVVALRDLTDAVNYFANTRDKKKQVSDEARVVLREAHKLAAKRLRNVRVPF